MNSPATSEKQQLDQSWGWDHHHHQNQNPNRHNYSCVTMSVGLETRQFQGGRVLDYDWGSSPVLLSGGGGQQAMNDAERKPQIMSGGVMDGPNTGQYNGNGSHVNLNVVALNGMLSSGMSHNSIIAEAAQPNINNNPLASLLCTRGYGGGVLEGIRSSSSASPFMFGNGHNVLSGYNSSSALEEQRHHLLGMMAMDQKSILHNIVKHEELCAGDFQARIGLNLGGRTYFSTEDNIVSRLYKRPRAISPSSQVPRCQAEGCKADLSTAKHYHRRHKVCELHSKAATVVSGGISQRFCQQCSRFHVLSEFDEGKRSCRKRLADHNRRRRKPQPNTSLTASNAEGPPASPVKATEGDQDTNSESNQSNAHPEPISRTEAQALVTGISLSSSLPLVMQSSKGQQQYMQQPSASLSRIEMGAEYPRHNTGEKYNGLEIVIPWLKPADSSSEYGGSEKNSSSNGAQVSESGTSSSSAQVFSSIQNLLPSLQSSTELGNSDWMMHGSNNARNHQHYASADLNLQTSLDGQQMFSLLEKSVGDGLGGRGRQNAVEYMSQGGLNSKHAADGHSQGFSGMQSLRSLGHSMYQNIL